MTRFTIRQELAAMLVILLTFVGLTASPLQAQSFYGSIVGNVTDGTGAILPGATVSITNMATNDKRTAESNASGDYSFVSLVPSTYKVEATKANFKRFLREQVTVQVNAVVRVDASLQVGSATETVEVTTQMPLLQTDSGSLGSMIEGKTVNEMPLNGRNSMNLLALAPGVVPLGNSMGSTTLNGNGHTQTSEWADYSIAGGAGGQNAMYVDGAPMNVLGGGGGSSIGYVPVQDSIQEFNVISSSSDAQFGRFSGGVINMTTKSGSNAWHGSAYEYLRNNVLNANRFFDKQTQLANHQPNKRGQWNQSQFGGVISGPIKKDKAFFLFTYEGFAARTASGQSANVPTANMQNGYIVGINGQTGAEIAGPDLTTYLHAGTTPLCAAATYTTAPTSGVAATYIPLTCWNATSAVLKTEYPAANGSGSNNFSAMSGTGTDTKSYTGRVDYNLNANNRLFGRYTASNISDKSQETIPGGKKPDGSLWHIGGGFTVSRTISGVIGDTYTINPTTILDLRLSYMRWANSSANPTTGMDMSIYKGVWGTLQNSITETTNPAVNFNGNDWSGPAFRGTGDGTKLWNDNEALAGSLTKIAGKHTLKIGAEGRLMDEVSDAPPWAWIGFGFDNNLFTQNSWANFLIGKANDASITNFREVGSFNWYHGFYVNDSWQATRKLTITGGLRLDLLGNIKEKRDRSMELIVTPTDATAVLVNSPAYTDRGSEPAGHQVTPHLGFAYRLTNNDSIRGGYGYNILPPDSQSSMFPQNFSMNAAGTSWNASRGDTPQLISNPFPGGLNQPLGRNNFDPTAFYGRSGLSAPVPTTKVAHTQQWNLSASHQFKGDLMVEIGYAASKGSDISMSQVLNQLASSHWTERNGCPNCQSERPYPKYNGTLTDVVGNIGTYSYHSLPVRVEKRFRSGGLINASYVWSKALGDVNMAVHQGPNTSGGIQDWNNLADEHALASYDVPHRVIVSYVLNLPFGKGQRYLSSLSSSTAQHLISGWAVNGIVTLQKGFPLMFGSAAYTQSGQNTNIPASYGAGLRPNYTPNATGCNGKKWMSGSVRDHVLNGTPILNAACWSAPTASTDYVYGGVNYYTSLGNQRLYEGDLRAPGARNFDLSVAKKTSVTEKVNLEFRMEFFNLFNHMQFPAEATAVGSSGGGFGSTAFGVINSSSENPKAPRIGQASLRLNF